MKLWKYFDLAKFVALLQTQELHFCRGDKFDDPLEGSYPLSARDIFEGGESGYSADAWRAFVAVSCWHLSDIESDAMWRLYTSGKQGVAIQTTREKLETIVMEHAYVTDVDYIDFLTDMAEIHIPTEVFHYKRKAYVHEKEVRAIITHYPRGPIKNGLPENSMPRSGEELPERGIRVELSDIRDFVDKVVVTPYAEPWFFEVVKGLCTRYGFPESKLVESELKADPVYAKI
jgi:hypothetical protein